MTMTSRQVAVIDALRRAYRYKSVLVFGERAGALYVMVKDTNGDVILSVEIPDRQDPDRPDVGDRVQFITEHGQRYGLIVVYRDMNDTVGIVPDGLREIIWEHINSVEIVPGV
jgi:hypothetical protein